MSLLIFCFACSGGGSAGEEADDDASTGSGRDGGTSRIDAGPPPPVQGWPESNTYSWDGRWQPAAADFPLDGIVDDEYGDGHEDEHGEPTPVLPPGEWDWDDANDDLANWRNHSDNLGSFDPLRDEEGHHCVPGLFCTEGLAHVRYDDSVAGPAAEPRRQVCAGGAFGRVRR